MRYRLFISDFDGTLVRADGTISQANRRAIEAYRADGGIFAVCTGRMPAAIVPRLKELGLREGPVVAYQGATVLDIATGELLKDEGFAPQDALRILSVLEEKDLHIHAYTVDALYCNRRDAALKAYERVCGVQANVSEHEPLSALFARTGMRAVKLLAMVRPEQRVALMNVIVEHGGQQIVGRADRVKITGEMQVDVLHRHHLCVPASGGPALDAEHRTERRLAQRQRRILADAAQAVGKTDGGGGFALPGRRGGNGGDQNQFAVPTLGFLEE